MANLEHFGKKDFSTVFISIVLSEQHSKIRGNQMYRNIFFSYLNYSRFTDGAWQQGGASLHLQVRSFMTCGSPTPKIATKGLIIDLCSMRCLVSHVKKLL